MDSPESSPPNSGIQQPISASPGLQEMEQLEPQNSWRPLLIPAIVVIVGLGIAWALFAHYGKAKPDATGQVLRVMAYPVKVDSTVSQTDSGMEGSPVEQNEIILLVQLQIKNIGKHPLNVFDLVSNVKLDGTNNRSAASLPEDIDRLFERFPDLSGMRMPLLTRRQEIGAGQTVEGLMVFNYAWTQQQWDRHKDGNVVVSFVNGRTLKVPMQ